MIPIVGIAVEQLNNNVDNTRIFGYKNIGRLSSRNLQILKFKRIGLFIIILYLCILLILFENKINWRGKTK